jgi:hypothetical protein
MATWLFSQERLNKDLIRSAGSSNPRRFGLSVALQAGDYVTQCQLNPRETQANFVATLARISQGTAPPDEIRPPRLRKKCKQTVKYNDNENSCACYAEYHGPHGRLVAGDLVRDLDTAGTYLIPDIFLQVDSGIVARVRQIFQGMRHPTLHGHYVLRRQARGPRFVTVTQLGPAMCGVPSGDGNSDIVICENRETIFFDVAKNQ